MPSSSKRVLDHLVFYGSEPSFCRKSFRSYAPTRVLQNLLEDPSTIHANDMVSPILPLFAFVSG